jgi:hypothetical protein
MPFRLTDSEYKALAVLLFVVALGFCGYLVF